MKTELEPWPICRVRGCGDEINPRRADLGYTTCLSHASLDPKNAIPPLMLLDVNKSNPTITRRTDFLGEAYADRKVQMQFRQTDRFVRLGSTEKRTRDE
jgi:hypothetical protein